MYEMLIALISAIIISILFICRVNAAYKRRKEYLHQDIRDNVTAERNKQLLEVKDKGDFDIWNHND